MLKWLKWTKDTLSDRRSLNIDEDMLHMPIATGNNSSTGSGALQLQKRKERASGHCDSEPLGNQLEDVPSDSKCRRTAASVSSSIMADIRSSLSRSPAISDNELCESPPPDSEMKVSHIYHYVC